ncbi:hypothetical protein [Leifsonia sp. Leaf264]|uniref:hypothetical protein n=1 Tax=Leifsonia sp. Leaf264 TaxID=1736314 RepID=UPI0006FD1066|nr:hypothetical protein [Leifsonia sp. Leaf264]KQO98128.1 hypothetical protein ASF30_08575 [Leifsonia sp. Leaf264]
MAQPKTKQDPAVGCAGVIALPIAIITMIVLVFQAWWGAVEKEWRHGDFFGAVALFGWWLIPIALIWAVVAIIRWVIRNQPSKCPNCGARADDRVPVCNRCGANKQKAAARLAAQRGY